MRGGSISHLSHPTRKILDLSPRTAESEIFNMRSNGIIPAQTRDDMEHPPRTLIRAYSGRIRTWELVDTGMNTMLFLLDCPGYHEGNGDGLSPTILVCCCWSPVSRILDWSVSFGFSVFDELGLLHHD